MKHFVAVLHVFRMNEIAQQRVIARQLAFAVAEQRVVARGQPDLPAAQVELPVTLGARQRRALEAALGVTQLQRLHLELLLRDDLLGDVPGDAEHAMCGAPLVVEQSRVRLYMHIRIGARTQAAIAE